MCGIVGILGTGPVVPQMLEALGRLEYRGYDSAGVATLFRGKLERRRAEGKLSRLAEALEKHPLDGRSGIGHTRWATHGKPNETNAHPHATDKVAVVHNGIIENFRELRKEIEAAGRTLESDTDTEIIPHLITMRIEAGDGPIDAVKTVLHRLRGAFALAVLFEGVEDLLIAARRGSPLAIAENNGSVYVGSDAIALAPFATSITYLEDGDWAVLTREHVQIYDENDGPVERVAHTSVESTLLVDKGGYNHYMAKEIAQQPEVVAQTLSHYLDFNTGKLRVEAVGGLPFAALEKLTIVACGTSYYAAMVAKYWIERYARLPVDVDIASEFRYREPPLKKGGAVLVISQSGETIDTLESLRHARKGHQFVASIVNVPNSAIAREADMMFPTLAGPEIGVASTKAFTCQLAVLAVLAIAAGIARGTLTHEEEFDFVQSLSEVPRLMSVALKLKDTIAEVAKEIANSEHAIYLGRGTSYPIALEGALKLKEISYINANGYPAGELKHGPLALVKKGMPVVVIAPSDHVFEKTASNMEEVSTRDGNIILITDEKGLGGAPSSTVATLVMPNMSPFITPLVYAVPIQLLAYQVALVKGTDIDKPRNLAKSVTVE